MMKNIGILTSGGDSPGMNAAIRSIVISGIFHRLNIYGIKEGYLGLYLNNMIKLNRFDVSNLINKGGTFLGSSRFLDFKKYEIRLKSIKNLNKNNINALIVIGGNGSYIGALKLIEMNFPCICIPGTIDNDVIGTDYSIGFFTALENIIEAIDKLRDTSSSHKFILIVEVMGRNCGDLAVFSSIAGGCEFVILPEYKLNEEELINKIKNGIKNGKTHLIIIATENTYNINSLSKLIEKNTNKIVKHVVLGYIQRGGKPTSFDRILASKMGYYSISLLINNDINKCIGIENNKLISYDIKYAINNKKKKFNENLLYLSKLLF